MTTWLLGWWKPALFERKRSHHKWPIFVPVLMLIVAVVNLFNTDWSKFDASFVLALLALGPQMGPPCDPHLGERERAQGL